MKVANAIRSFVAVGASAVAWCACAGEGVTLLSGDAAGECSFDSAGHWSDGAAPSSEKAYAVALGATDMLRTPVSAVAGTDVFAGGSLTLGDAEKDGVLRLMGNAPKGSVHVIRVPNMVFNRGWVFNASAASGSTLTTELAGSAVVNSTASAPFTFAAAYGRLAVSAALSGDETACVRVGPCPDGSTSGGWIAITGDNSAYKGQFVVDGRELRVVTGTSCFGAANDGSFRKDALVLRNGATLLTAKITGDDNTLVSVDGPGRGIWVEDSSSGFNLRRMMTVSMPIGGETVAVSSSVGFSDVQGGGRLKLKAPFAAKGFSISGGGVYFAAGSTMPEKMPVKMSGKSLFGLCFEGTALMNLSGADLILEFGASDDLTESGLLHIAEGSTIASNVKSIKLRILDGRLRQSADILEWEPILTIPVSVKEVSADFFSLVKSGESSNESALTGWQLKVETKDGLQTVFVKRQAAYVVPAAEAAANPDYLSWETAGSDINAAIAALPSSGGIVLIAPGTYAVTDPVLVNKSYVTLRSFNRATGLPDAERTVLDGGYPVRTGRVLVLAGGLTTDALQSGRDGVAYVGLTVSNAAVNSTAYSYSGGAGLYAVGGPVPPRISGCRFVCCHADSGYGAGASTAWGGVVFENCLFAGNTAKSGGAGVNVWFNSDQPAANPRVEFNGCTFADNTSISGGGGAHTTALHSKFRDCLFTGNRGGDSAISGTPLETLRCTFRGNIATEGWKVCTLGPVAEDCTFIGNTGGNQLVEIGASCVNLTAVSNSFTGSSQMFVMTSGSVLDGLVCTGNTGSYYAFYGNGGTVRNALVATNSFYAMLAFTSGTDESLFAFENCTFAGNRCSNSEVRFVDPSGQAAKGRMGIANSILWGNGAVWVGSAGSRLFTLTNCCAESASAEAYFTDGCGCFRKDPRFVAGGYSLRRSSPCRDTGRMLGWMTAASLDLAGNPRVVTDGVPLAENPDALPDIGCYENQDPRPGLMMIVR